MNPFLRYTFWLLLLIVGCKKDGPEDVTEKDSEKIPESAIIPADFLSEEKFEKLTVEVLYVKGFQPATASVNNLKTFLEQRLKKPDGIFIVQKEIAAAGKTAYSLADLREIEEEHRSYHSSENELTAYFFFADGDYAGNSGNSKVLGVAYGSSSMTIFEKTVKEYSGGLTQPPLATLESTVILHEFAHILGLVNNGTAMTTAHQDEAHGRHCTNENCLMYYTAETTDIIGNLMGGNVPQLDNHCLADLKANGGR